MYYTGINTTHYGALDEKRIVIGRASWRRDGFFSLDNESTESGMLETEPLYPSGTVVVNADAAHGIVRAELLQSPGKPIPGFSADECIPVRSDSTGAAIRWKNNLKPPGNSPVRLRLYVRNARVFSFGFAGLVEI
jgi:hypothetical protein